MCTCIMPLAVCSHGCNDNGGMPAVFQLCCYAGQRETFDFHAVCGSTCILLQSLVTVCSDQLATDDVLFLATKISLGPISATTDFSGHTASHNVSSYL